MSTQPPLAPLMGLALGMALLPAPAFAADGTVGLGLGVAPPYLGAREVILVPLPSLEVTTRTVTWRTNNFGIEAGLPLGDGVSVGPILRVDGGRGSLFAVKDAVIARLPKVKAAPEVGGFIEAGYPLGGGVQLRGRVSLVQGLGAGHGGLLGEGSASVLAPATPRLMLGVSVQASWQDRRYARAFFGVDTAGAAASGLPEFQAGAGLRDLGAGVFVSRLQDSAARSPVVRVRGRRDQILGGLALAYRF
jgi:MipA family protein